MSKRIEKGKRLWIQLAFTAVSNGYLKGYIYGTIFKGPGKSICLPGLNCYSCPGALGSCPLGAFQAVINSRGHIISFYALGFMMIFGAAMGRLTCGWLCPFGLMQDLLYKVPFLKKVRDFRKLKYLGFLKYIILALFVVILPMFFLNDYGQGSPWFCKYVCPSGTLMAGVPLTVMNEGLRATLGWFFTYKIALLVLILALSVIIYRPFCRIICPLGAIYGLFNKVSIYKYYVDNEKCTKCGRCIESCKMGISVWEDPNSFNCIRCGDCIKACPYDAITGYGLLRKRQETTRDRVNLDQKRKER